MFPRDRETPSSETVTPELIRRSGVDCTFGTGEDVHTVAVRCDLLFYLRCAVMTMNLEDAMSLWSACWYQRRL